MKIIEQPGATVDCYAAFSAVSRSLGLGLQPVRGVETTMQTTMLQSAVV